MVTPLLTSRSFVIFRTAAALIITCILATSAALKMLALGHVLPKFFLLTGGCWLGAIGLSLVIAAEIYLSITVWIPRTRLVASSMAVAVFSIFAFYHVVTKGKNDCGCFGAMNIDIRILTILIIIGWLSSVIRVWLLFHLNFNSETKDGPNISSTD